MNITISRRRLEAIKFACRAHAIRTYGDNLPYHVHLQDVEDILIEFGYTEEKMLTAAQLHDIIEDCGISFAELSKRFGLEVADMVYRVSDFKGRNRKERHSEQYWKELKESFDSIVLKLADRIANIRHSIETKDSRVNMYSKEHSEFKERLQWSGHAEPMWAELDKLVEQINKNK